MKYKVSGAIAIPKASWGCAPALPNRIQVVFLRALFHMKHFPWNTTRIGFGKAGAHPQLALGIALSPETFSLIATF